jgi:acetoin utilization protein AcuB
MTGRFHHLRGMPPIVALMTPFPHSIAPEAPVSEAQAMMAEHDIRHLPVKRGEELVGTISEREVTMALGPLHGGARRVGDVAGEAYVVDLLTPTDEVLLSLADRRLEAALVVKEGRLAGIFTVTDAYRAFADLLGALFPKDGGEDAA